MSIADDAATPASPTSGVNGLGGRMVELHGTGRSRGAAHGEELRGLIADAMDRWRAHIAEQYGCRPERYVRDFLGSTRFVETVRSLSPDLFDEVVAIAAASNQPLDEVMAYNLMDEEWRHDHQPATGCSVIGAALDGGSILLSQNMDLPTSMGGSQAVLRIAAAGEQPAQLVLTAAGMIGLFGVNEAGVACCVNTLKSLPSSRAGMPVAFLVRLILGHRDAESAGRYLETVPHASGQHYAVADRRGVRGYECSADGCVSGPRQDWLVHTNHPLWTDSAPTEETPPATSHTRLHALEAGLQGVRRSGDVEPLLSSTETGLCVPPTPDRSAATFCSAEFVLTSPPSIRIALGRPNEVRWQPVSWA
jgi:isopenicillin-N N-acyltransferase like protein